MMETSDFRFEDCEKTEASGQLGKEKLIAQNGFKYKVFSGISGKKYQVFLADYSAKEILVSANSGGSNEPSLL